MVAFWTLRLYSDWRGTPQPHVVEGLLVSAALPLYLLAIVLGFRVVRRQPSVLTTAFIVGGVMFAAGLILTVYLFGVARG
jgi:hypothetical protein